MFVGETLVDAPVAQFRVLSGSVAALGLQIAGTALRGLELRSVRVYLPHGEREWRYPLESSATDRGVIDIAVEGLALAAAPQRPEGADEDVDAMQAQLLEENRSSLVVAVHGRAHQVVAGALKLTITSPTGPAFCNVTVECVVEAAPRPPVLPPGATPPSPEDAVWSRWLALCDAHEHPDYGVLSIGFGGPLRWRQALIEGALCAWASDLARLAAALGDTTLPVSIECAGAPSRAVGRFGVDDVLGGERFGEALLALQLGADLCIGEVAGRNPDLGYVWLGHRPFPSEGPALSLVCCLPQPELDQSCALLATLLRRIIGEAAAMPECRALWAGAIGAWYEPGDPLPYELLLELAGVGLHDRGVLPAWRTLVPLEQQVALSRCEFAESIEQQVVPSGVLLASRAPDPFSMDTLEIEAFEAGLAPLLRWRAGFLDVRGASREPGIDER